MDVLIEKFIAWWQTNDELIGQVIFAENFYWRGCSRLASGNGWEGESATPGQDIRILSKFSSGRHGTVVLEETDQITLLHYRHALVFTFEHGKIVELIATKEHVEMW